MKQRIINLFKDKGFLITLGFSLVVLFVFFGKPLFHANVAFFGVDGDGIQAYFTSLYHAKYDESFLHFNGMNYPYGENVFFTGCQPTITGFCRLFGLSDYIIGITNLIMLLSVPICALFIYLIFKELGVNYLFAAACAVAISYLSPQIIRMNAHYTLTYQFVIPSFIYCLIKFYKSPTFKKSILIGIFTFFVASTHLYFFGFFVIISAFYWLILFSIRQPEFKNIWFCIKHGSIQVVIPFAVLQIITVITNTVHDRTQMPFGFMLYRSSWAGVFFPFGHAYHRTFRELGWNPGQDAVLTDEGLAYIGFFSVLVALILGLKLVRDFLNFNIKKFFMFTDNVLLNIFLWSALVAMFYSFAYPFVFGHEDWVKNMGPLKQMRAAARFAWIFYYVINIVMVYLIFQAISKIKYQWMKVVILFCTAGLMCLDAHQNIRGYNDKLNNRIPSFNDKENALFENAWLTRVNIKDYQAIMPLPYFHVGSENFNFEPKGNIKKSTFIISLKTGIPVLGVNLSRTSLSQSFKNIEMMLEPSEPLKILEDMNDKRPFLVLADKSSVNNYEADILSDCVFLFKSNEYEVYKLDFEVFANRWKKKRTEVLKEFNEISKYKHGSYFSTDSVMRFVKVDYDSCSSPFVLYGKGALKVLANCYSNLYYGYLPNLIPETDYSVSFWMRDYVKDINMRTAFSMDCLDSIGQFYTGIYSTVKDHVKRIEGDWILIEGTLRFKHKNDMLKVTVWAEHLMNTDSLEFDDFLARPLGVNVYQERNSKLYKNNRNFIIK